MTWSCRAWSVVRWDSVKAGARALTAPLGSKHALRDTTMHWRISGRRAPMTAIEQNSAGTQRAGFPTRVPTALTRLLGYSAVEVDDAQMVLVARSQYAQGSWHSTQSGYLSRRHCG